jgi:hypothetical protein
MPHFPFQVPDVAVGHAAAVLMRAGVMPHKALEKTPDDLAREAIEAALPYLQFSPLGDNHHNAKACPYCSPAAHALTEERNDG